MPFKQSGIASKHLEIKFNHSGMPFKQSDEAIRQNIAQPTSKKSLRQLRIVQCMSEPIFRSFDLAKLDTTSVYKLIIGSIVPRPIAFVSTLSSAGIGNLAPFSFFTGISSKPPCLMISVTRKADGGKKDTLRNIEATGEFVVNVAPEGLAEPLNQCSAEYPFEIAQIRI